MKFLLDTHVFLWSIVQQRLSASATAAFLDAENELFLSAASYWEISIKRATGKLVLMENWIEVAEHVLSVNQIQWLPIERSHCQKIVELPFLHGDPFDRMLIAQALCEGMTIMTADQNIGRYVVSTLW